MNEKTVEKDGVEEETDPVKSPTPGPAKEDEGDHDSLDSSPNRSGDTSPEDIEDASDTGEVPVPTNDRGEMLVQQHSQYTDIFINLSAPMHNQQKQDEFIQRIQNYVMNALSSLQAASSANAPHIEITCQSELSQDENGNDEQHGCSADPEETTDVVVSKKTRLAPNGADITEDKTAIVSPAILPVGLKYVLLQELLLGFEQAIQEPINVPPLEASFPDYTLTDYRYMVYHRLVKTVNLYRSLAALQNLPANDRAALLKGRLSEIGLIHYSIKHNMETGMTYVDYPGTPYVCFQTAKRVKGSYYEDTLKLKKTFPEKYRTNDSIYTILCAITLFNPECPNVSNKAAVEGEQRLYLQLFKEYMESTYGEEEGRWAVRYLSSWMNYLCLQSELYHPPVRFDIDPFKMRISNLSIDGNLD